MTTNNIKCLEVENNGSISSTSCNSITSVSDVDNLENDITELNIQKNNTTRKKSTVNSTTSDKTPPSGGGGVISNTLQRKAKRVRFYRNGDKFFGGVVIPVMQERYRSFDSLTADLTRTLVDHVNLPSGVRSIYNMDGRKVSSLDDLEDGKAYVCLGKGETFKRLDYNKLSTSMRKSVSAGSKTSTRSSSITSSSYEKSLNHQSSLPRINTSQSDCVRPRIVTLIRNGIKPRKVLRLLLNKRNAANMDQALASITDAVRLDSGAVRRVFTLAGTPVQTLSQFFENDDVFFVYGNERYSQDDFELEFEESKAIQQYKKTPVLKHRSGPKPKMPKKTHNIRNDIINTDDGNSLLTQLSKENDIPLPPNLRAKYNVGRTIGDGNFAVVRVCKDKQSGQEFALKIIDKSKCKGKEDMVENEVRILRQVNHPRIMSLIEEQDTRNMLYLVVELVKGGDLFDAITVAQTFSEDQAALMISHLASALAYLHNMNIVHRDVKPENLLVELEGDRVKCLKLGDFGLACEVQGPLYTVCGTPTYVAPEILAETGYGLKIDVWAAGVILYILLCGFPPFISTDNDQDKLFDAILLGQYEFPDDYWSEVSPLAKELIQHMLQLTPSLRFSAEDVLDHPWLATRS